MAKRKLTANLQQPTSTPEATEAAKPSRVLRGHMDGQLRTTERVSVRAEVNADISADIRRGRIPVELFPDQIQDVVGSDRSDDWQTTDEFARLKENIETRGQTQPIRVRPADPSWTPHSETPKAISPDATFFIQSGRRRVEACRQLGIKVMAFISADIDLDLELADLEERYHENTAREDLSSFDRLLSIGAIHRKAPKGTSQSATAQRLGVKQEYVSLGTTALKHRDAVEAIIDTASATMTELKSMLPKFNAGEGQGAQTKKAAATPPKSAQREFEVAGAGRVRLRPTKSGLNLSVQRLKLEGSRQDEFEVELRQLLEKFAAE